MDLSRRAVTAGLLSLLPLQRAAAAVELPHRIVVVVPFGAGSGIDFAGRLIADKLSKRLQLPVVVENRPGAGGMPGAEYVAHAQPDGGTLLLMDSATVVQKWLHKDVPFNVETDFAPVAKMTNSTLMLCAQAAFQCNSIKELVTLARSEPGKLSCGTSGIGSPHHLDLLLFNSLAHINIVNVAYHSSLAAVNDLLGGQIPLAWSGLTAVGGHIKAGKLKALGSASEQRDPNAPGRADIRRAGRARRRGQQLVRHRGARQDAARGRRQAVEGTPGGRGRSGLCAATEDRRLSSHLSRSGAI